MNYYLTKARFVRFWSLFCWQADGDNPEFERRFWFAVISKVPNAALTERRPQRLRPLLQVAYFKPRHVLPSSLVGNRKEGVVVDQAADHESEETNKDDAEQPRPIQSQPVQH